MTVSREFVNAMNGVLNGEKWKRESWQCFIRFDLSCICYFDGGKPMSLYRYDKKDMTATDWERVG